jgi:hypothetical protein
MFTGAAVDTYFHERIRRTLLLKPMSASARQYGVQLGPVADMVDAFLRDRSRARPRVKLGNHLHEVLLSDTFQGSRAIERAFGLLGVKRCWTHLSGEIGESAESIKDRLNRQYARRNRIAHEGDYVRKKRPRAFLYENINERQAEEEILWTRQFLTAADKANPTNA